MNHFIKVVLLILVTLGLVACQGGSSTLRGDKSQYADEQPRGSYLNSPAYINVQLGIEYMKKNELGLALSKLKKALAYNPNLAIAHSSIAVLYERIGEKPLAKNHYQRSVSLDGNDSRLRNNYGQFLCRNSNEEEGIKHLDIAAKNPLYPAPEIPLANAGVCAMRLNDMTRAENYFYRALEKHPRLPLALRSMIRLQVDSGNYLQAKEYLQRYKLVGQHTAETLWLGYQIEKNSGDRSAANNFAVRLKSRFPKSSQTRLLLQELSKR